jgi:hypothetical protein
MENKKLNEQLNKMKSLMTEQEVQEDMLDDIKNYLYGKVQGVKTKLSGAFDDLLDTGDSSEVSSSFVAPDEKPEELSQEEKLKLFSTVKNDDDFYKAILFGIGAPTSKHNIDFLKLWRIAEMGTEDMNKKKVTATNNPLNTTFNYSLDRESKNYNSVGVKHYSKPEYGVDATIKTLKNGYYNCIVQSLRDGISFNEIAGCRTRDGKKGEFDVWGTTSKRMLSVIERFKGREYAARKIDQVIPK